MPQPKRPPAAVIRLSLDGRPAGTFRELTGLDVENKLVEMQALDEPLIRKIPGATKWSEVTLSRGIDTDTSLWEWRQVVTAGGIVEARRDAAIELVDIEGKPIATYNLHGAWPVKYSVSQTTSDGAVAETAIESITLAHEGFGRA
jgi:phage tail-like protein